MFKLNQLEFNDISHPIDGVITCSGYESRSIHQAQQYRLLDNVRNTLVLGFNSYLEELSRPVNDEFYHSQNAEISIVTDIDNLRSLIENFFSMVCKTSGNKQTSIYVDYSCMPKDWYSLILLLVHHAPNQNLKLYFGYSHALYSPHKDNSAFNRVVEPMIGFCHLSLPSTETVIIITLGNNKTQTEGLKEYFDTDPYLIYSDLSFNKEFSQEIEDKHRELISATPDDQVFKLPIHSMQYSYNVLFSLAEALSKESRVIFTPCGPKPFTLINLIVSLNLNSGVDVWRISQGRNYEPIDRIAQGLISVIELEKAS
ncbi:MAG: hypothetical protein JJ975_09815 [Bacteroidia bacterium]|nr:hypothetical protein [Bacteroidia bacterium]